MARRELAVQAPLSARGPGSAPRLGSRLHGRASSASPRPQSVRPVEAVRLAKDELSQKAVAGKTARLKLAALPLPGHDTSGPGGGKPGLHEGFYDFASGVINPKPSAREHALQLCSWLESELQLAQQPAETDKQDLPRSRISTSRLSRASQATSGFSDTRVVDEAVMKALPAIEDGISRPESGTFLTGVGPTVEGVHDELVELEVTAAPDAAPDVSWQKEEQCARRELELCLEVLEKYAEDTTTQSKERSELLTRTRTAAAASMRRMRELMAMCMEEVRKAVEEQRKLEAQVSDVEEDNAGLRKIMQQMLTEESRMRGESEETESKAASLEEALKDAKRKAQVLVKELEASNAQLREMEERRGFGQAVRDASNSPMMGFASFPLGAPPVPGTDNQVPRWNSSVSLATIETPALALQDSQPNVLRQEDVRIRRRTLPSTHLPPTPTDLPRTASARAMGSFTADARRSFVAGLEPHLEPNFGAGSEDGTEADRIDSLPYSAQAAEEELGCQALQPVPVAPCAFPALIPFLDFSSLDLDYGQDDANATQRNREHLETHLAMLEREHQEALSGNEHLQSSVDTALEQLMVWIQAVWDSLQDCNSQSVAREMEALDHLRKSVEWLAAHPVRDWTKPEKSLAQFLGEKEGLVRGALAAERESDLVQQKRSTADSESLLEVRTSLGPAWARPPKRGSRLVSPPQDVAVQCDLQPAPATAPVPDGSTASEADKPTVEHDRSSRERGGTISGPELPVPQSSVEVPGSAFITDSERSDLDMADMAVDEAVPATPDTSALAVREAVLEATAETKKMRLLRSPWVEGIDLTTVPSTHRVLLMPEGAHTSASSTAMPTSTAAFGLKTLHTFISEVYSVKKVDDQRRDKGRQPRRELHTVLQELMKQKHGVRNVVHQRSWIVVESLLNHLSSDQAAALFVDFLDGSRDLHELSFYLYCSSVLASAMAEESQEIPPVRTITGCVAYDRATRLVETLFGELPKALEVIYVDLQKCARSKTAHTSAETDLYEAFAPSSSDGGRVVPVEDLYKVLLEGWRASLLLLDKSAPGFSWRHCVLAFIQTDVLARGWLDPHEVRESEETRLQLQVGASGTEGMRILPRTTLGAYVFRAFHRCNMAKPPPAPLQASKKGALRLHRYKEQEVKDACLQVSQQAFQSVEKVLGVYLTRLMHSEELRDVALYNSVKARIYGFRQATEKGEAALGTHEFRCLLLLLLSHQFDVQRQSGGLSAGYLHEELASLLGVLRQSWRHGAHEESGFGPGLEESEDLPSLENIH